jgi:hypothetical protein
VPGVSITSVKLVADTPVAIIVLKFVSEMEECSVPELVPRKML